MVGGILGYRQSRGAGAMKRTGITALMAANFVITLVAARALLPPLVEVVLEWT
jgi:hypothetical protein